MLSQNSKCFVQKSGNAVRKSNFAKSSKVRRIGRTSGWTKVYHIRNRQRDAFLFVSARVSWRRQFRSMRRPSSRASIFLRSLDRVVIPEDSSCPCASPSGIAGKRRRRSKTSPLNASCSETCGNAVRGMRLFRACLNLDINAPPPLLFFFSSPNQ